LSFEVQYQVVPALKIQVGSFGGSEVAGHPKSRVGGDSPLSVHDLIDTPRSNPDGDRRPALGDAERLEVLVQERLARVDRRHDRGSGHGLSLSVVVDDLDEFGACVSPSEADPPLLVDANAVVPSTIAFQILEPIPRRHPQITQGVGCIENDQLAESHPLGALVELPHSLPLPNAFGVVVSERPDHIDDNNGSRQ
jgi:hypothetical protein